MATRRIRIRPTEFQYGTQMLVTLDDISVGLKFRHCKADGFWHMWILDTSYSEIAGPIRLVAGIDDLWGQYRYLGLPPGALYVTETPDIDTVDIGAHLQYTEAE